MANRPFFRDPDAHADGPAPRFGRGPHPNAQPLTPHERRLQHDWHRTQPTGVLPALQSLLYVLIVALFLITFTVQPIRIPSASMEPTLLVGDFLLLDKASAAPGPPLILPPTGIQHGDVVVFHDTAQDPSVHLVKRVIAVPGDRLHLREGVVYLNEQPLVEPYAIHRAAPRDNYRDQFPDLHTLDAGVNAAWWVQLRGLIRNGEITVPPDEYFVLGDNRNDSEDSRYWGFVPRSAIVGKPLLVYFSWQEPDRLHPTVSPEEEAQQQRTGLGQKDPIRWDRTFHVIH